MAQTNLNAKHARFVQEYLKDLNATKAAARAGYSPKTSRQQGARLLSNAAIQEAIAQGSKKLLSASGVTAERIISAIEKIAFGDIRRIVSWNEKSVVLKDSNTISDDDAAMVLEISQTVTAHGGTIRFKRNDPLKALDLLGRYKGLWSEGDSEAPDDEKDDDVVVYLPSNGR